MIYRNAIVRPPGSNFADGLTTVDLGKPSFEKALAQHGRYCQALVQLGLTLHRLPADLGYPDSTFVEDAAILTPRGAILTRPGAASRAGEVTSIAAALGPLYPALERIAAPGTVDGGDICEAGDHYFIGVSHRTNDEGARQLARLLEARGYTSSCVDIRGIASILHFKSGVAWLSGKTLIAIDALAAHPALSGWEILRVDAAEEYAANCVPVNDAVLFAAGFPRLEAALRELGHRVVVLDMSEFQKMDGGLSCLSLRF